MRFSTALACGFAVVLGVGCVAMPRVSSEQLSKAEGPKVRPDERRWRRKPFPLPPLYMRYTSGSGNRWTMVTPFYWQVIGRDKEFRLLFPLARHSLDRPAQTSSGHVLNWVWGSDPERSYRVLFPLYWNFRSDDSETSLYGPLYHRREGEHKRRTILFPWIFSRETDRGYDYWGILFRLFAYEKQVFQGEERKRLWLFFVIPVKIK